MDNQLNVIPPSSESAKPTVVNIQHAHKFIFGYLALIILVAVVASVYQWQHKKVISLNGQLSSESSKVSTLQKQVVGLQSIKLQSQSNSASNSTALNQILIKIPTLGVNITVPNAIKDLKIGTPFTSSYKGAGVTSVYVSTQTISTAIPQCSAAAFGTLSKTLGQYPTGGVSLTIWHEQFNSFYLTLSPGEASCAPSSTSKINQDLLVAQSAVFDAALPSIQPIK